MTSSEGCGVHIACPIARALTALAFILLLTPAQAARAGDTKGLDANYPLSCTYFRSDLDQFEHCARRDGEMIRIAPAHLAQMHFRGGVAEVRIPEVGCLWARRDGLAVPVFVLDNGSDPFEQGLTRGTHHGKVAFYDRHLRLVLATDYDWSFPFNGKGQALVCTGCRSDGQQPASMVGGRWGIIDRKGRIVMPLTEGDVPFKRFFGWSG